MRSRIYLFISLIGFTLAPVGCSRQVPSFANTRLAVQVFENQSADRDLNWAGHLIAHATVRRLSSDPLLSPSVVRDAEGWRELGSGRVLSGVLHRTAKGVAVEARLTDAMSFRVIGSYSGVVEEKELVALTGQMIESLLGTKAGDARGDFEVWAAFARAIDKGGVDELASVVARYPGFSIAYPLLAELLRRSGRLDEAKGLAAKLPAGADALSKAQLAYGLAEDAKAKLLALKSLIALRPTDVRLRGEAGLVSASLGEWARAVDQYKELTKLEVNKPDWWNSLGYAHANLNQLPEALAALNEYRRLVPNEPNTLDSLGEVNFMNRQFKDAARFFDEAAQKFPGFQNGVCLRKAAFAFYRAGDLKTADVRIETWLKQVLGNAPPRVVAFQRAMWLVRTGRWPQAQEFLSSEAAKSAGDLKAALDLYLVMMRFGVEGVRPTQANMVSLQQPIRDPALRSEFSIFALLSQPIANVDAMDARIQAAVPQPQLAQLRSEIIAAGRSILSPVVAAKPRIFPLPNVLDSTLDALVVRSQLAVIP